jgi:hypothetical protein
MLEENHKLAADYVTKISQMRNKSIFFIDFLKVARYLDCINKPKLDFTQCSLKYSSATVSVSNTFQDLPRLRETADNTERYI